MSNFLRLQSYILRAILTSVFLFSLLITPSRKTTFAANLYADTILIDNSTNGYYNNALGTSLDGTQLQFPINYYISGKDPTLPHAPEPNITSVNNILGVNWLSNNPLPLNANWSALQPIPMSWSANLENAIIYPILVGPQGYSQIIGNFGVDNGLYIWVNGRYKFGAMGPGAVGGFEYLNVDLGSLPPGMNYIQILREDHGDFGGFTIQVIGKTDVAGGHITDPIENQSIDSSIITFSADAWSNNGSSVKQVEFFVFYDGIWHASGLDTTPPYQVEWQPPNSLASQILRFRIDVTNNDETRVNSADVVSGIDYREANIDTNVVENWVPFRVYLNQRTLNDSNGIGDYKCSAASMTMILAMNSLIDWDYKTMSNKANEMYPRVLKSDGLAYYSLMVDELNKHQHMVATFHEENNTNAWKRLKDEINAGYPVIVRTQVGAVTLYGHFFVAVGYRETPFIHEVITYDPFGEWKGTCCNIQGDYNANDPNNPESQKGKWVYYDFNKAFGISNVLITSRPQGSSAIGQLKPSYLTSTRPDLVSDEPETLVVFNGVRDGGLPTFLPIVIR